MAKVNVTQVAIKSFDGSVRIPRNRYTLRCLSETFDTSKSSGNPMITRQFEIVAPEVIDVDGAQVNIGGINQIKQYLPLKNVDESLTPEERAEKTAKSLGRFAEEQKKLGLNATEVDDENPLADKTIRAEGLIVDAILSSEETVARMEPTAEQKKAKQPGTPIKDANGKEIKRYQPKLEMILGVSTTKVNRPF